MKKIFGLLSILLLNSCAESIALLGPASSAFGTSALGGGNVAHSALSSAFTYSVKKQTGKSPSEHAVAYVKKHNPNNKKEKCIKLLESTNSEMCSAFRQNILETKKKIVETKKKIVEKYKIEDLASKAILYNRR